MLRLLTLFLLLFPFVSIGQPPVNYLSFEGGGSGIIASANIGKTVYTHQRFKIISQLGLGWTPMAAQSDSPFNLTLQTTCNFGNEYFYIEAGVGSTFIFKSTLRNPSSEEYYTELYLCPIIGIRHEIDKIFGRIYACPLINATGTGLRDEVTTDFIKFGIAIGTRF